MKSLISKTKKMHEAMNQVSINAIYHYDATTNKSDRYIVWAENSQSDSNYLNNHLDEQAIQGTIDLYTKKEFDDLADEIQDKMIDNGISFSLFDVQYERETHFIHYTWNWVIS